MFNPTRYENTRPDGLAVLEITDQEGRDDTARQGAARPAGARLFVPLKRTELHGEVAGPLAALRLIQVYGYSKEQSNKTLEAAYRFPLPGDAAVTGVSVRMGEVAIRAELEAREQAEAEYAEAKRLGQQAALATRESPDVFTLKVTGLQPDQDVTVETTYVQLARAEGPGWALRIPLTTAPRYVRTDELTSRHAHGQPFLVLRDPGHRFALDLVMRGAAAVESDTHALVTTGEDGGLRVRLRDGEVLPDRDCVLRWRLPQEERQAALQVLLHDDPPSALTYFLALVAPPATCRREGVPREVILLVDHSGSMTGPKWEAADWAVEKFLSGLGPRDAFTVGVFHGQTFWFSTSARAATPEAVSEAVAWLKGRQDSGGTDLGVALEQALNIIPAASPLDIQSERARHVLIITDAQVTDDARILRLAEEEAHLPGRRRISVLCIDAAPNSYLANELAERGGGVARFLTSSPEEEDITTALDEVLAIWGEPALADARLLVNRAPVEAGGRAVLPGDEPEWQAIDLGTLPLGRSLWVVGRVGRGDSPELIFRLMPSAGEPLDILHLDVTEEGPQRPALKALFGARRVAGLEYLIHALYTGEELADRLRRLGYDPQQVMSGAATGRARLYAENARADAERMLRDLLRREALEYGLASSETAFVAVRTERGQPAQGTVPVANALPVGWAEDFVNPPPALMARGGGGGGGLRAASYMTARGGRLSESPAPEAPTFLRRAGPSAPAQHKAIGRFTLFQGEPRTTEGQALLFDSAALPEAGTIRRLMVRLALGWPDPTALDSELALWLYVGDLASPRARVSLADLARQGGERPLNIARQPGEVVRLVLRDPARAWAARAPQMEVALTVD